VPAGAKIHDEHAVGNSGEAREYFHGLPAATALTALATPARIAGRFGGRPHHEFGDKCCAAFDRRQIRL
jgi:hypothetical protein